MQMYHEAYKQYISKCESYGIEGIEFKQFQDSITPTQAKEMLSELN